MVFTPNLRRFFSTALVGLICVSTLEGYQSLAAQERNQLTSLMSIRPRQATVEYDRPTANELKSCKVRKPDASVGKNGYVVVDGNGRMLRQFLDMDGNGRLDQWSYYREGIEVYRDKDTNGDNKVDEYRWLGTAGLRWGLDRNQDGEIDAWRMISAEEVASEVFESIKAGDSTRFRRVLLTEDELEKLKLGAKLNNSVAASLKDATSKFANFARSQREISKQSKWVHFGTSQPNLVAAGNAGSQRDVVIYDHASAVFQNGRDFGQVAIGTIVQVGSNSWRAVELPQMVEEGVAVANGGILFPAPNVGGGSEVVQMNPADERVAKLFSDLEKVDQEAARARKQVDIEKLESQRAELRTQLIENCRKEDRVNWIESLADTVTDAYQRDRYPDGLTFLAGYKKRLQTQGQKNGPDYIAWRLLNTKFSKSIEEGDRRARAQATEDFIEDLENFVDEYPGSRFSPECLNNLGMHYEVSDRQNPKRALGWYKKLATDFSDTNYGKKAKGAITRLSSAGKPVSFVGKTADGRTFNLAKQNKIVVIHYWETWCDVCIDEFETFQRLAEKYKREVLIVGANIDQETEKFKDFMAKNGKRIRWTQLHQPGGVDGSPLAHQLGPSSLPLVILFDADGNLVESGLPVNDLDREIQRLIRKK